MNPGGRKSWEPTSPVPVFVEVLGRFTIRSDGSGTLRIKVDGEKRDWELHSHVVTQLLRIRETFAMKFDLHVRVVENMKVSPEEPIPYIQIAPRLKVSK